MSCDSPVKYQLGRQRRQLFHVAAAVTPWPPEKSTPSPARSATALQAGGRGYNQF